MSEDKLFTEFRLKNFTLRNRIGLAPMTRMSSPADSVPRRDVLEFLVRRAQNGAAIIFTEAVVTDYESAQGYPGQARMVTQRQIDTWKPVVEAIRKEGAIAIMQMFHCGRMAWPEINPANRVIAPSAVAPRQKNPLTGTVYPEPDIMSHFDIDHVVTGFAETAKGAVAAGFDGIEIHGAHGYLISQFLSAYSNRRTDEYGGSVDKRFRFAHEIIQAVRRVLPDEFLVTFRISDWGVADPEVSLFGSKDEYQEVVRMLSREPVDALSVSTHDYKAGAFGTRRNMARITRDATDLPIMICGKIYDRESADDALKDADVILSAKSMLLNPNWVEDIRQAKPLPLYKGEDADIAYTDTQLL